MVVETRQANIKARLEAAEEKVRQADSFAVRAGFFADALRLYGKTEADVQKMRQQVDAKADQLSVVFRGNLRRVIKQAKSTPRTMEALLRTVSVTSYEQYQTEINRAGLDPLSVYLVTLVEMIEETGLRGNPKTIQTTAHEELERCQQEARNRIAALRRQIAADQNELDELKAKVRE